MSGKCARPGGTIGVWFLLLSECLRFILLGESVLLYNCCCAVRCLSTQLAYPFPPADAASSVGHKLFVDELWTQVCVSVFVHVAVASRTIELAPKNSVLHLDEVSSDSFL